MRKSRMATKPRPSSANVLLIVGVLWIIALVVATVVFIVTRPPAPSETVQPVATATVTTITVPPAAPTESASSSLATVLPSPSPAPTLTATPEQTVEEYTVQEGDTLSEIAERFGVSIDELVALNGLSDPHNVQAGRILLISAAGRSVQPTTESVPTSTVVLIPAILPPIGNQSWQEYHLMVDVDYQSRAIVASEKVWITNLTSEHWDDLMFYVAQRGEPGVFDLGEIKLNGEVIQPEWHDTFLWLALPEPLPPAATLDVTIDFVLHPPPIDASTIRPQGNVGWGYHVVQAGDWYPVVAPRQDGAWLTWEYTSVGDPFVSEVANYDVTITAPVDVNVIGSGLKEHKDNLWHFQIDKARSFAFMTSRSYVSLSGTAPSSAKVTVWYPLEHIVAGQDVLKTAIQSIELFSEYYGPYPYDELTLVENGYWGSMEYTAFISLGIPPFRGYTGTPDTLLMALTAHEVSHQWWYSWVGNDQVREPWLDEALAMYSEYLYYERYHSTLLNWWWAYRVDKGLQLSGPINRTIYDFNDTRNYANVVYGRSAHFAHELRQTIGDEAFFAFLQDYGRQFAYQLTTGDDFWAVLREHTPADLTTLREEYFEP